MKIKPPNWLIFILSILFYIAVYLFMAISYQKGQNYGLEVPLSEFYTINKMYFRANIAPCYTEISTLGHRVITAYNPVPEQTDSTPCISASGMNICETSKNIAATNELPFGTLLVINGKVWEVQDRTNERYTNRIDLLMYNYQEAKNWGKQTLIVELIN